MIEEDDREPDERYWIEHPVVTVLCWYAVCVAAWFLVIALVVKAVTG